jgi:ketosteroid isomerase-like protein
MLTQEKDIADPQLTEQLDLLSKKFDEAYNNNDPTAVAALFTEDGVFVTPQGPIYGRDAIERYYADRFQQWRFSNHLGQADQNSPHSIGTAGNEMWAIGEFSQTLQGQDGGPIQVKGYWSEICVREGDVWKDRMLTYNINPPPKSS